MAKRSPKSAKLKTPKSKPPRKAKPAPVPTKAKLVRRLTLTTARIKGLVEKHVKKPFTPEQSKDVTFFYLEGRRLTDELALTKVRRKEIKDQIGAENAERSQAIAYENEHGRGSPEDPQSPNKQTEPYTLGASRKISGHELEVKRLDIQLADVEKQVRELTASTRSTKRSMDNSIDNAWEGPSLFDKDEETKAEEPKTNGESEDGSDDKEE